MYQTKEKKQQREREERTAAMCGNEQVHKSMRVLYSKDTKTEHRRAITHRTKT